MIVVGAVGGTLLTHFVADLQLAADLGLIALFATLGIGLSLLVNYWIVRRTMQPLHELRQAVERVQAKHANARALTVSDSDPDLSQLAAAINSMLARVEGRTVQLRALSERAINAQEDERKRIARGLHDGIGQDLSLLIINLERMETSAPEAAPALKRQLAAARQAATRVLEELRQVVLNLRPSILDDLGLAPAIRWYAQATLDEAGQRLTLQGFDDPLRLSPELETALFRIAQEALNNIRRHADARAVLIRVTSDTDAVTLDVEDDGRGFEVAHIRGQALRLRRFGLLGMQERAELVGGALRLDATP